MQSYWLLKQLVRIVTTELWRLMPTLSTMFSKATYLSEIWSGTVPYFPHSFNFFRLILSAVRLLNMYLEWGCESGN
jgi:hypothetical protein